jgi:hypothetical protein
MNSVYRLDGATAIASELSSGPWGRMQHGSAPASLIAHVAEALPAAQPMRVARLTIDLMRPVPIAPLTIKTEVVRDGRKIRLLRIDLLSEGTLVVSGSVLQTRRAPTELPPGIAEEPVTLPGPDAGRRANVKKDVNPFLSLIEISVVKGGFNKPGPCAAWFRAEHPIIEGMPISKLMAGAIAADFCNGASAVLDFRHWTFINGDLTISLARDPVDDWILLDAETWLGPDGAGLAFGRLADKQGYFGRAVQSILIEPRGA